MPTESGQRDHSYDCRNHYFFELSGLRRYRLRLGFALTAHCIHPSRITKSQNQRSVERIGERSVLASFAAPRCLERTASDG